MAAMERDRHAEPNHLRALRGSRSRKIHVQQQTIAMLQALPKNYASNVFNPNKRALQSTLARSRKRIAKKLQMPNLNNIHHHSFRRYFADQAYKKTRFNVRKVQHASDINTYLQPRNTSTTSTTRTARMKRHEPTRQKKPKNSGS